MGCSLIQSSEYSGGLRSQQLFGRITEASGRQCDQFVVASLPNYHPGQGFSMYGIISRSPPLSLTTNFKSGYLHELTVMVLYVSIGY